MSIHCIDLATPRPSVDPTLAIESMKAIGKNGFAERLVNALSQHFRIGHLSMFAYGPECKPVLLGTGSTVSPRVAHDTALVYLASHYRSDPGQTVRDAERPDTRQIHVQYQVAGDIADYGYRAQCYDQPRIADRVSILQRAEEQGWIVVNIYRDLSQGVLSRAEFDSLLTVAPLLTAAADRHAQIVHQAALDSSTDHDVALQRLNPRLSTRERETCAGILEGLTAKEIARRLNIAPTSVVTHRKNAYLKLGINDHKQLFALIR